MKKLFQIILIISCLLILCSCEPDDHFDAATENVESETITEESANTADVTDDVKWNYLDSLNIVFSQGENYCIYTDDLGTAYKYFVSADVVFSSNFFQITKALAL